MLMAPFMLCALRMPDQWVFPNLSAISRSVPNNAMFLLLLDVLEKTRMENTTYAIGRLLSGEQQTKLPYILANFRQL